MKKEKWITRFNKSTHYQKEAETIINNQEDVDALLNDVMKKVRRKNELDHLIGKLKVLFQMIQDYVKGNYKEVPKVTILIALASLIYFVSPIDFNPDFLPFGLIDDATIIAFFLKSFGNDLENYLVWKETKETINKNNPNDISH